MGFSGLTALFPGFALLLGPFFGSLNFRLAVGRFEAPTVLMPFPVYSFFCFLMSF